MVLPSLPNIFMAIKKLEIFPFFLQHIITRFVSYLKDNLRKEMIK